MAGKQGVRWYAKDQKSKAMLLWASGACSSDEEIAGQIGCARATVQKWRSAERDKWERCREQLTEERGRAAARRAGEALGDVIARQLEMVGQIQTRLIDDLLSEELDAATPAATAHALLKALDVERELSGGVRSTQGHVHAVLSREEMAQRIELRLEAIRTMQADGNGANSGLAVVDDCQ